MPACKTFTYKNVEGLDLSVDIYHPNTREPTPVVLLLHAGGLIAGGRKWLAQYQIESLLAEGYTVAAIDYRLAPETKAQDIISDVLDAIAWIREGLPHKFPVRPDKLAVIGYSAGGFLTLLAGHLSKPRPTALVSFYGYGDIQADWVLDVDPYYSNVAYVSEGLARRSVGVEPLSDGSMHPQRLEHYVHCRQHGTWVEHVFGKEFDQEPERLAPYCPIRHIDGAYPPTLLVHGDADTDVPYVQSVSVANKLREYEVDHHLVTIPGGPHTFDLPEAYRFRVGWSAVFSRRLVKWLSPMIPNTVLKGAAPPEARLYMPALLGFLEKNLKMEITAPAIPPGSESFGAEA